MARKLLLLPRPMISRTARYWRLEIASVHSTNSSLEKRKSRLASFIRISAFVVLAVVSTSVFALPMLGRWLIREDSVRDADAIAVLTGHFPDRAMEAAELYRSGYAPEVWLTHPAGFGLASPLAEDVRNFRVLRAFGVPRDAIRVLDTPIVNTADELNAIDSGLRRHDDWSVIIVTSKVHTRRVASLWDEYHLGDGEIMLRAASDDDFSPSHWWQKSSSRAEVFHEVLGILNGWLRMPVHRPLSADSNSHRWG
jgi:DUF218 domain-containing protein